MKQLYNLLNEFYRSWANSGIRCSPNRKSSSRSILRIYVANRNSITLLVSDPNCIDDI